LKEEEKTMGFSMLLINVRVEPINKVKLIEQ